MPGAIPTPVGVNRTGLGARRLSASYPHARGGEPSVAGVVVANSAAIPTPVGVNRAARGCQARYTTLSPRPWG